MRPDSKFCKMACRSIEEFYKPALTRPWTKTMHHEYT